MFTLKVFKTNCFVTVTYRYAATYSTINAFTFTNILSTYYILSYDLINILNLKSNLIRNF